VPWQGRFAASSVSLVGLRHAGCRRDRFSNNEFGGRGRNKEGVVI
jgi:hypothetical protein